MENLFYQFDANSDLRLDATAWLSIATLKCEFIRNAATPSDKSPVFALREKPSFSNSVRSDSRIPVFRSQNLTVAKYVAYLNHQGVG